MNALAALERSGVKPDVLLKRLEAEQKRRADGNQLARYAPYPKQLDFHAAGKTRGERLLMCANQVGKTIAGAAEAAIHLTGRYPKDWTGHRFDRPIRMWAGGVTNLTTRDVVQAKLVGPPQRQEEWGTGFIPRDAIVGKPARSLGIPDGIDTIQVRHVSGAVSHLAFKSYEQGREKWQADTLDALWFDEEPPQDIYTEGKTRMNAVPDARAWITFTPLKGMSEVVKSFVLNQSHPDRAVVTMTIDDAPHFSEEQRRVIIARYQPWELEARTRGIPSLGSGRVFPVTEESIRWTATALPRFFRRIAGLDFGWDHPTACVWLTWDTDSDTVYVTDCYRVREQTPVIHAAAIKARGAKIPVAWPHDGLQHDKGSGEQLAQQYRTQGVAMLPERAQFIDDRGNGVEAGLMDMLDRMQTGRFKVAEHLSDWWEEFRLYHREDGKVVKEGDDLMCLHGDTLVITERGRVRIAALVGSQGRVLTIGNRWAAYRDCRKTQTGAKIYRLDFADGSHVLATANHRFLTSAGWAEAIDMQGKSCHIAVSDSDYGDAGEQSAGTSAVVCRKVSEAGKADVYCLSVPETEAFAVEGGLLVHNCATRYAIMCLRFARASEAAPSDRYRRTGSNGSDSWITA